MNYEDARREANLRKMEIIRWFGANREAYPDAIALAMARPLPSFHTVRREGWELHLYATTVPGVKRLEGKVVIGNACVLACPKDEIEYEIVSEADLNADDWLVDSFDP